MNDIRDGSRPLRGFWHFYGLVFATACLAPLTLAAQEESGFTEGRKPSPEEVDVVEQAASPDDMTEAPPPPDFDRMSARDFFELLEFGPSYWEMLLDNRPLSVEEQEAIVRALTRLRRLQPHRTTRWLQLEAPWDELAEQPDKHRLEIYLITGEVVEIRRRAIPPEAVEKVGLAAYFEVDALMHQTEGTAPGTIVVERIPEAWQSALQSGESVKGQPFSCPGVFLKADTSSPDQAAFIFATPKISWHPVAPDAALGVSAARVQLARQGLDVAELANIADRTKFGGAEREPFYQMMAAIRRISTDQLKPTVDASVSKLLTQRQNGLMVSPEDYRGEILTLTGLCRRITRIEVDDEDIQQRLGIDQYFEVSVFVPIEAPIVSQRQGDEATRKEFDTTYPILICVPELPPGLEVGEDLHRNVTATGAFFKLWAYRTPFMSREDFTRRQISPLLIAPTVQVAPQPRSPQMNEFVVALLIILAVVAGTGIAFGMLFSRKPASRRR